MENIKANNNTSENNDRGVNSNTRAKSKTTGIQKKDYYEEITNKIIKALENNTRPWVQPWDGGMLSIPKHHNNTAYQGINMLILSQEAGEGGYSSPYWMTFKQAKTLGGNVRKGETGATIFYAGSTVSNSNKESKASSEEKGSKSSLDSNKTQAAKDAKENKSGQSQDSESGNSKKPNSKPAFIKFMKSYKVFNANQIEGLPEEYYKSEIIENENLKEHHLLPKLEEFIQNTKADIRSEVCPNFQQKIFCILYI